MKVVDNKPIDLVDFSYIEPGTVFKYGEGDNVYMRITSNDNSKNAVNLSSGYVCYFSDNAPVEMLPQAHLILYENDD